ncbi:hypothetical protein PB1_16399 [Bacillus methanolicus PB1]|uniref:Uncharacterized protein n=1 Tax=Bacillus methanolicus PB1 TaxID=997296 RepID=I3DY34_BACMT|nr:hypothetical protein [Bacillus methanolicus]EIJ79155.1 hypothetical protein PB1_16399 [Bacillus methanolicus PB1]
MDKSENYVIANVNGGYAYWLERGKTTNDLNQTQKFKTERSAEFVLRLMSEPINWRIIKL